MRVFVRTGSALLAVAAMAGSALAADSSAAYDWSGFYAGLNAGVLWDTSDLQNIVTGTGLTRTGVDYNNGDPSFTGGGILGYNWQFDQFVLGVEADINYGNQSGDIKALYDGPGTSTPETKVSYESEWFSTLRARAGFAFDNILIYGTGGLAYSTVDTKYELVGVDDISDRWDRAGWVAGGGLEYAIDRWSLGAEYLYVDLPGVEYYTDETRDSMDFSFSTVRATLKYHF